MRGSSGSGSSSERRLKAEAAKRQTDEEAVERGAGGAVRQSQHRGC
jgi:hypothetical protein